jgi:hypothetical protein
MFVCPECGASQPVPGPCVHDGAPLAPVGEDVLLGVTIGAYRIARLLGVGGMGRVYKGVQPQIGSRVAIKVLSRECSDRRDLVERFFSEARAVNLIRHESIVNVLDLASLPDGRPYIIMEYLDGAPLSAAVDGVPQLGPLPVGSVARLAVEVLDALGAAHAKGIVHRDLKPDNIFVTPSGRPKVLDFGIAKLLPELGGSYTQTGSLLGTPHYMSPEQATGQPVDYRTDLYAMGVILFECVTGTKPFHGDSLFDLLRKHVDAPPARPSALRRDLPPAFEHVILAALAKAPDQRWPSAQAMSMALQQAAAQLPPDQWAPLHRGPSGAMRGVGQRGAAWDSAAGRFGGTPPPVQMPGLRHPTAATAATAAPAGGVAGPPAGGLDQVSRAACARLGCHEGRRRRVHRVGDPDREAGDPRRADVPHRRDQRLPRWPRRSDAVEQRVRLGAVPVTVAQQARSEHPGRSAAQLALHVPGAGHGADRADDRADGRLIVRGRAPAAAPALQHARRVAADDREERAERQCRGPDRLLVVREGQAAAVVRRRRQRVQPAVPRRVSLSKIEQDRSKIELGGHEVIGVRDGWCSRSPRGARWA